MSFRGDAHRFYVELRNVAKRNETVKDIKELVEVQEIVSFYQSIDTFNLKLIYYRMVKEKNGSGIIPLLVTSVPWFFFLFSKQLQEFLFQEGSSLWLLFSFFYLVTLSLSIVLHFREKAWAELHIKIIQNIIDSRNEKKKS
ncbi:hypothetical protein [Robertmurraya mangrovi]|uniref:hypothetical protein n=1 Tax=Robertmurraya mangrovi TaxID=3098077 RepID=UPI002ACC17D2|nr:hypothetical protein [Bacillus sp. 31A1R]